MVGEGVRLTENKWKFGKLNWLLIRPIGHLLPDGEDEDLVVGTVQWRVF